MTVTAAEKKIAIITPETIGPAMSGPGIRHWEMALALVETGYSCLLWSPKAAAAQSGTLPVAEYKTSRQLIQAVTAADIIISAGDVLGEIPDAVLRRKKIILDMITPRYYESLENNPVSAEDPLAQEKLFNLEVHHRYLLRKIRKQLEVADYILCGTERQREYLIGMLTLAGKITPGNYQYAQRPADYIVVVPHGMQEEEPRPSAPAIKGVVTGIGPDDKVLLWWGCSCDWYDFGTVFKAMAVLAERRLDVKLVLTSPRIPTGAHEPPTEIARWLDWAREKGLYGKTIFVLDRWIPYHQRAAYLLEATAGIYAHRESLETHYSIRTRFYDYLWGRLPMLITAGDCFEQLVRSKELGIVLPEDDVAGWSSAIERLADDRELNERIRKNIAALRSGFTWQRSLEKLLAYISLVDTKPRETSFRVVPYCRYLLKRTRSNYRRFGLGVVVHKALRHVRKLLTYISPF